MSEKYFGDLVPKDRMEIKPKPKKENETVQRILKQYRKNKNKFAVDNL